MTENRWVVARGEGRGEGLTVKGKHEGFFWGDGAVLYPHYAGAYMNLSLC